MRRVCSIVNKNHLLSSPYRNNHKLIKSYQPVKHFSNSTTFDFQKEKLTMEECIACWTTCASQGDAEDLASILVEEKLCACVTITPGVTSVYWWDNKINKDQEFLLMMKTLRSKQEELVTSIKKHHKYDVPEVICVNIEGGNPDYLDWVRKSLAR